MFCTDTRGPDRRVATFYSCPYATMSRTRCSGGHRTEGKEPLRMREMLSYVLAELFCNSPVFILKEKKMCVNRLVL